MSLHERLTASVLSWAIFDVRLQWSRGGVIGFAVEFADQALSVIVEGFQPLSFLCPIHLSAWKGCDANFT